MKVLLISANKLEEPFPVYPIGLDFIAGAISPAHDVHIIDMGLLSDLQLIKDKISLIKPDVVGISIRNIDNVDIGNSHEYIQDVKLIISCIRESTGAKIVVGGSGFSIYPARILADLQADFGLVGEGEKLSLLLEALEFGRDPSTIPGLLTPKKTEYVFPKPWLGSVRRQIPVQNDILCHYLQRGKMLNLQTKRGCPFACAYCTYPIIEGRNIRYFEPQKVANEAKCLQNIGAGFLFIVDSVFNSDPQHAIDVAEAFKKVDLSIPWGAYFSPISSPNGFYTLLAKAGLTHVEFGTDSLCSSILRKLNKPFSLEQIFDAHNQAREAGINIAHYLVLGGPGENRDTLTETLENAQKLRDTVIFIFEGIRIYPGTELYKLALKEGLLSESDDLLSPIFYASPSLERGEIADKVAAYSKGRINWIVGGGGQKIAALTAMMHKSGSIGPLWEKLAK